MCSVTAEHVSLICFERTAQKHSHKLKCGLHNLAWCNALCDELGLDTYFTRQHGLHDEASTLENDHVTQGFSLLQDQNVPRKKSVTGDSPDPPIPNDGGQPALIHQGHSFLALASQGTYQLGSCNYEDKQNDHRVEEAA